MIKMEEKVKFYTLYERLWHWIQAIAAIILLITGFEISYATYFSVTGFTAAVDIHNIAAIVFVVNAFLAFFYNVAGGLIKRYIPEAADIFPLGFKHASYYIYGIFMGDPHPFDKTPEKRLLPMQKITYFMIMGTLLPLMIVTGSLKLAAYYDPSYIEMFGGLKIIGPIHRFGAWMFASFVIVHVYMITTGHTIFSNLLSMITGYEYMHTPEKEETK
jgi:thiosulfate reductase cytochrome b subunit